jgi:hypothetical protein
VIDRGLVAAHLALGLGVLALVVVVLVMAGYAVLRRTPPPAPYRQLQRVVAALVLAEAAVGVLLFIFGKRPHVSLHLVYALVAVVVMPLARTMARRHPSNARFYHLGGTLLLLGVLIRLVTTG